MTFIFFAIYFILHLETIQLNDDERLAQCDAARAWRFPEKKNGRLAWGAVGNNDSAVRSALFRGSDIHILFFT
jgi:hypothetical protein